MSDGQGNALLEALPAEESGRLSPYLVRAYLPQHTVLVPRGRRPESVYFPVDAVASTIVHLSSGQGVEAGTTGSEGAVGLPAFQGAGQAIESVIQVEGDCWRMREADFRQLLPGLPTVQQRVERFTAGYLGTVAHIAACNRVHPLEGRAARWLLMMHDRAHRDRFALTHDFMAVMFGVQRPSVTLAVGAFRRAGVIDYTRGQLTIRDRPALESLACECYEAVRALAAG